MTAVLTLSVTALLITCVCNATTDQLSETFSAPGLVGVDNATWQEALTTMSFHRTMMNEYLCRSYLAADIVHHLANTSDVVEKRNGETEDETPNMSLMDDPGSSGYKDWLSRSSTLEDIYRHYEGASDAPVPEAVPPGNSYDSGAITGYAMVGTKAGTTGHGSYGTGPWQGSGFPEYGTSLKASDSSDEKGMKLKDLFTLALTAVAFLAFKVFLIEVLMCLFHKEPQDSSMIMFPTVIPAAVFKQDTEPPPPSYPEVQEVTSRNVPMLNDMAARVLATIEALSIVHQDGGVCLQRTICEANKYSRSLTGVQKLWLPLWSFGVSWVAGRQSRGTRSGNWSPLLGHLKAVVLGFGNADCSYHYPACDGTGRKSKRKRK